MTANAAYLAGYRDGLHGHAFMSTDEDYSAGYEEGAAARSRLKTCPMYKRRVSDALEARYA